MIKSFVRWAFAKTRWRVVRAATINDSYMPGEAISHNSLEGWDHKFRNSDIVHNYYTPSRHRLNVEILETIVRQRGVQPSETIGDVGCGLGYFLQAAAERFRHAELYGYDFSVAGLELAQKRVRSACLETHDILEPVPRIHHVTVCSQTLEHLLDPERAANNLIRATCAGGIVVITVPDGRLDTYKGHINFWSPESWEEWIKRVSGSRRYVCHRMEGGTAGGANLLATIFC